MYIINNWQRSGLSKSHFQNTKKRIKVRDFGVDLAIWCRLKCLVGPWTRINGRGLTLCISTGRNLVCWFFSQHWLNSQFWPVGTLNAPLADDYVNVEVFDEMKWFFSAKWKARFDWLILILPPLGRAFEQRPIVSPKKIKWWPPFIAPRHIREHGPFFRSPVGATRSSIDQLA